MAKKSDSEVKVPAPKRPDLDRRWASLLLERSSWMAHWKDISTYMLPRSGRFFLEDRNRGEKRHNNIYDSTGTRALRILGAGLMGGATSPARPWFRLATPDPDLNKREEVKVYLNNITRMMHDIFQRSNTYRTLHSMYEELGAFGTGASIFMDDYKSVIRHCPLTVGEYCLGQNYNKEVNVLYREFQQSVAGVVGEFGYKNCSRTVQALYDRGSLETWVTVVHAIEPRGDRDPRMSDNKNMPWSSVYFERGQSPDQVLRESGFKQFRVLAPRWAVTGGDVYGNGPGMETLGDVKQLQHEQLRKAKGIDLMTDPPLQVPSSLKNRHLDRMPGGISFTDGAGGQKVETLFDVRLDLSHLLADIQDVRGRINGSFYTDLFLMLSQNQDNRKTATEVAELHEEKLLMLGPTMERLSNELFSPMIDLTFSRMLSIRLPNGQGILPPPPPALQGQDLNIEYISMLAQAQSAISTNGTDRFVTNLGQVAQFKPGVLDKFNEDKWADSYSDMLGVDPELIVGDNQVAIIRKKRADQQAQQQKLAAASSAADTANKLAKSPTNGKNALTDMANMAGLSGRPTSAGSQAPPGNPTSNFSGY